MDHDFSELDVVIAGVRRHVSQQQLNRYPAEFDFRHNERAALDIEDQERTEWVLRGMFENRLTCRDSAPITDSRKTQP